MDLLFDKKQCKSLMNDFYTITKIKIVIYDTNFEPIISVPANDCDFCAALKKNPSALEKCNSCIESEVKKCKKSNALNIYKCHAGLTEAVAPLRIDDIVIGYIMFGQIVDKEDKNEKKAEILTYAAQYSNEDMSRHFSKITSKNIDQIHSVAKLMEACISYLVMHKLIKSDHTSLAFKLANFIETNLSSDLSVDKLCEHFDISRNSLYKIFNDFYGMSVARYIRKKRIDVALELISSGTSITDASIKVGFGDYNYFSKVFKSETGTLPSKFRKKVLQKHSK